MYITTVIILGWKFLWLYCKYIFHCFVMPLYANYFAINQTQLINPSGNTTRNVVSRYNILLKLRNRVSNIIVTLLYYIIRVQGVRKGIWKILFVSLHKYIIRRKLNNFTRFIYWFHELHFHHTLTSKFPFRCKFVDFGKWGHV